MIKVLNEHANVFRFQQRNERNKKFPNLMDRIIDITKHYSNGRNLANYWIRIGQIYSPFSQDHCFKNEELTLFDHATNILVCAYYFLYGYSSDRKNYFRLIGFLIGLDDNYT